MYWLPYLLINVAWTVDFLLSLTCLLSYLLVYIQFWVSITSLLGLASSVEMNPSLYLPLSNPSVTGISKGVAQKGPIIIIFWYTIKHVLFYVVALLIRQVFKICALLKHEKPYFICLSQFNPALFNIILWEGTARLSNREIFQTP